MYITAYADLQSDLLPIKSPELDALVKRYSEKRGSDLHFNRDSLWMNLRFGELKRLVAHRRKHGQPLGDLSAWAKVIADVIVFKRTLDAIYFLDQAKLIGIDYSSEADDVWWPAVKGVLTTSERKGRFYQSFAPQAVANMLDVTSEERWAADIKTVGAIDADPEKDAALRDEERRARERVRDLRRRQAKEGWTPRPKGLDRLSERQPWTALGMSRATWYRTGKPSAPAAQPSP